MTFEQMKYGDDDFPVRARKLIAGHQPFAFEVSGEAFRQLMPYVVEGSIADPARLGLKPKLQPLLLTLMLADSEGQTVVFDMKEECVCIWVGAARA